jgi:hypothetical protein
MARGRKPNPDLRRYDVAGNVGPSVYLVEFVGQCVKVGRSVMPYVRLCTLNAEALRNDLSIGRFALFPVGARDEHEAERSCVRALRAIAPALPGRSEYFGGITFDAAQAVVEGVLGAPPQPLLASA